MMERMKGNPDLIMKYDSIIEDQLGQGIIEKVRTESEDMLNIPHHAVVDLTKATTKVRTVYDASAKTKQGNTTLNECLYRGPVIILNLTGILFQFRMNPIALVADTEKKAYTKKNNIQTYPFCISVVLFSWQKQSITISNFQTLT